MTDRRRPAKAANGAAPSAPAARLAALRAVLKRRDLTGFVIPRADEHQGEYVPPCAERLAWLTGFTGSAGLAIVLTDRAAVFVDGRYTLQVAAQVDASLYELRHITNEPPEQWLASALQPGTRLGIDPWLHTPAGLERLEAACRKAGAELVRTENAVDAAWTDRPAPPKAPVVPHDLAFAGRDSASKRAEIAQALAADKIGAVVLTLPESIAWLLNVRGGDVAHSPLPLSFAILDADARVDLFLDPAKISPGLKEHLGAEVAVYAPARFGPALDALGRAKARVQADPATAADWVFQRLAASGAEIVRATDPCLLPKACKNEVELNGTRAAHRRDGAALTRFLAWLARTAPSGKITEIAAAERLEAFRRESNLFRDLSFDTISGAGPNGAIVHYRVTEASNRRIEPGMLYLVDSGAQYPDGTTDVTRTVAVGTPPAEAREHFTRVLKGHIALASVRFPKGTTGPQLDTLARRPLWEAGLDYDHGTGHGVGSYLGVHEGPQSISKRQNTVALRPGMIVSNEPGYYRTGAYGIRIENLVVVLPADSTDMLGFETLTLAPIDRALVEPKLMTADEIGWLDLYHARVREALTPLVDGETAAWLADATRPVAAG
ncbi:MAG TPA: aminopeptidase P family protein [Alphaproteobacteria bacterium]|jgi:Xaa-Pro aminopeptidase|nr:aminopeptidase P family protein [Alphaproteobacteria bacterium]